MRWLSLSFVRQLLSKCLRVREPFNSLYRFDEFSGLGIVFVWIVRRKQNALGSHRWHRAMECLGTEVTARGDPDVDLAQRSWRRGVLGLGRLGMGIAVLRQLVMGPVKPWLTRSVTHSPARIGKARRDPESAKPMEDETPKKS